MFKYKQDLKKKLLTSLIDYLDFIRWGNKLFKPIKKGYSEIKVTS